MNRLSVLVTGLVMLVSYSAAQAADAFKFEVFQDAKKEYRWRLKNDEGKVVATPGQGYSSKKYCEESVEKFKSNVSSDKVKIEHYQDAGKQYRWKMIASNGQNVASSAVGYATKGECEKAVATIKKEAKNAKVEVEP